MSDWVAVMASLAATVIVVTLFEMRQDYELSLAPSAPAKSAVSRHKPAGRVLWVMTEGSAVHLAWCVVGVQGCFLTWGFLQERLMANGYGEDN